MASIPTQRTENEQWLESRLETATVYDYDAIRLDALRTNLWSVLAPRFPQVFTDAFELKGSGAVPALEPTAHHAAVAIPASELGRYVGQSVFVRVIRASRQAEIVAAKIAEFDGRTAVLSDYDPAAADGLKQAGDALFHRDSRGRHRYLMLNDGDRMVSLVPLPAQLKSPAAASTPKRILLRERAEAVERGEYAPRVDLTRPEVYLAIDPATGEPFLGGDGKPVFLESAVTAVKIEQNVLAMPIIHRIGRRMIELLRDPEVAKEVRRTPAKELEAYLGAAVVKHAIADVITELEANPNTPLGIAYQNLSRICAFAGAFMPGALPVKARSDARSLLHGGSLTAVQMACRFVQASEHFAGEAEMSALDLFTSSRGAIMRYAAMPIDVFGRFSSLAFSTRWDVHESFALVHTRSGIAVDLNEEKREVARRDWGLTLETTLPGTTGCPAAQSLGGVNILNEFLAEFTKLVEERNV